MIDLRTYSYHGCYASCGIFLEYWKTHGSLTQQGFPLSDVFEETNSPPPAGDGKVHRVQYFERARFEEHTENSPPYNVLLGLLGTEQYQAKYGSNPPTSIADPFPGSAAPPPTVNPPTQPPASDAPAAACLPAATSSQTLVQACVSNSAPAAGADVTVYGRLVVNGKAISGAQMDTTWSYKSKPSFCSGTSGSDGVASCTRDTGSPTKGYKVNISVRFTYNGQSYSGSTSFTPQ